MRDLFEAIKPNDPMTAARRGARPALPRRFYEHARAATTADGITVCLDDKPIHTPARRLLAPRRQPCDPKLITCWIPVGRFV